MFRSFIWASFTVVVLSVFSNPQAFGQGRTVFGPAECYSSVAASATADGFRFSDQGHYEKALAAYLKAQKAEPTCAAVYNNLGTAYYWLDRHQDAINSYEQALRFKPSWAWVCYVNIARSNAVLSRLPEAERAINEAIRLNPKEESAYRSRGSVYLRLGRGELAAADANSILKMKGWRDKQSYYAIILAFFGYSRAGQADQARRVLDEANAKGNKSKWPFPVIRYLRDEISKTELLAEGKDVERLTEIHSYIGMKLSMSNNPTEAREHLTWVIENGKKRFVEYGFAVSEIERISRSTIK